MPPADASRVDEKARRLGRTAKTIGERLMRALRPAVMSAGPLRWLGLAMLALAVLFPLFGGPFYMRLGIETLLLGSLALSVDILLGYAGLLSLGQAAYFGLAAYISALMYVHVTQSFWLVTLTVMVAVGVVLVRPGCGRDPRPRRLLRPDHFWRSRNSLQDRAQHPRNRRLGRNPGHSGSDHHAVSRRRARSATAILSSTTRCSP